MSQFKRALLITGGLNISLFILGLFAVEVLILFLVLCLGELVIGLLLIVSKDSRQTGQAILLAAGICLLIGFSVCSIMMTGFE